MRGTLLLTAAAVLPAVIRAETDPKLAQSSQPIEELVVTAARLEQKLIDAPASISIVSRDELASRPYSSLVDALRNVEGLDVGLESTDKNGMATISMRGMPSDYTLVLIDGRRQSNVGAIYPNNFGGGQFAYLPPLDSVERIEIVRGPMSTLYGSDAMGGVVNIITRKVADHWHGGVTQGFTAQQSDRFGNDRTTDLYVAGPLIADRLGLAVRGSYYDVDESMPEWEPLPLPSPPNEPGSVWERTLGFGGGGKQVASTRWNAGFRLSYAPSEKHDVRLEYDVSRQAYDNSKGQTGTLDGVESLWRSGNVVVPNPDYDPTSPESPATITRRVVQPRVGYRETQRYDRDQLALTHRAALGFGTIETSLTRSTSNNRGRSLPLTVDERNELQTLWNDVCARRGLDPYCNNSAGFSLDDLTADERARLEAFLPRKLRTLELDGLILDTKLDLMAGPRHFLSIGGQLNDTDMEDGVFGMHGAGFRDGTRQTHRQWALFVEDNYTITPDLTLTLGLRHDHHNVFGSQASPRAYAVWSVNESWTVKGGISTGYKAPRPDELFPGITGFGGQGVSPFVGTPTLKPETSRNYEVAAYFDNGDFGVNVTAFLNRFEDKIARGGEFFNCEVAPAGADYCVDIGPGWAALGYTTFTQSINIDRAETRGVEIAGRANLPFNLRLRANYTLTHSEQKSGENAGRPIAGNPAKHMVNLSLDWDASAAVRLQLMAEGRYDRYRTFDTLTGEDRYYRDYAIFHLGASWQATPKLTINARVNNLLDRNFISQTCELTATLDAYSCIDDYNVKDKRRSLWMSFNVAF